MAGSQHRVKNEALTTREILGKTVRVGLDLESLFITLHSQEANLGGGKKTSHAFEHAQSRAKNGDNDGAGFADALANSRRNGGIDCDLSG